MNEVTRRRFVQSLPVAGAAFAVASQMLTEGSTAMAQSAASLQGHFHPKGKAPSKFTKQILEKAKVTLPFADTRDFDEKNKGLIAPMKEMKIMADAGHVAWDTERFQFLDQEAEFDSIHPSLLRQSKLNDNYGLYEVMPGTKTRGTPLTRINPYETEIGQPIPE